MVVSEEKYSEGRERSELGELLRLLIRFRNAQGVVTFVEALKMSRVCRPINTRKERLVIAWLVAIVRRGE